MAANFDSYLDVDVEAIEKPKAPPVGHYFATITGWKGAERFYDKSNPKKGSPVVEVSFKITAPDEDIDPDELETAQSAIGRTVTNDYGLDDDFGKSKLRDLGEKTCRLAVKGLRLSDMLNELRGQEVRILLNQRAGSVSGEFYPQVKGVISAE